MNRPNKIFKLEPHNSEDPKSSRLNSDFNNIMNDGRINNYSHDARHIQNINENKDNYQGMRESLSN